MTQPATVCRCRSDWALGVVGVCPYPQLLELEAGFAIISSACLTLLAGCRLFGCKVSELGLELG